MSYELDHSFLGKPHHLLPRQMYATPGVDWQYRVDYERLRKQRLERARAQMERFDLGALVLFAGANIRYITGSYQGNWKYNINIRYAVLPRNGEPVLFETAGSDLECARIDLPWLHDTHGSGRIGAPPPAAGHPQPAGKPAQRVARSLSAAAGAGAATAISQSDRIRPAMTWQWAEGAVPYMAGQDGRQHRGRAARERCRKRAGGDRQFGHPLIGGVSKGQSEDRERLAGHVRGPSGQDGRRNRADQNRDQHRRRRDVADQVRMAEARRNRTRDRGEGPRVHALRGCEIIYDIIVASGGNTSPYRRWATDKIIRQGDLVIVDINAVGPSGYFVDFVRNFKCAAKMTQKEIDLYRETYDSLYAGMANLRPGKTTADVVAKFPKYDDDEYKTVTLQQFAHSIGLTLYEGMWMSRAYSLDQPAEIKENMCFAIETFAGHPHLEQTCRLEEDVLVGPDGPVILTLMEHTEEAMAGYKPTGLHPSLIR